MSRIRVSSSVKLSVAILNEIFAILIIIVLLFSVNYGMNSGSWEDLLERKSYEQSDYFRTQSKNQATRAIRAASRATRFESEGEYDPERIVNVELYVKEKVINDQIQADGLCYRLGDLLKWAQSGWTYSTLEIDSEGNLSFDFENISNIYEIIESEYIIGKVDEITDSSQSKEGITREEFIQELENYFLNSSEEWISYYQYYQNVSNEAIDPEYYIYSKEILNEIYAPVNYGSIVEYARMNNRELSEVYQLLNQTLNNIVADVLSYRENTSIFHENATNVRYYLLDLSTGRDCSNAGEKLKGNTSQKEKAIRQKMKELGAYLIYNNQNLSVDTKNIDLTVTELYGYAETYGLSCSEDYLLAIGIDTSYPAEDILQQGYRSYVRMQPWAWLALIGGVIGVVGYILTFLFLSITAGETNEAEGVQLVWFDDWKTEISAAVLILAGLLGFVPVYMLNEYLEFLTTAGLIGIVAVCENALFITGWLSLIRRAKARTLWSNSLTKMLGSAVRRISGSSKRTTRIGLIFLGYLFAQMLFSYMGRSGYVLRILLNLAAGFVLIREAVWDQELIDGMKKFGKGQFDYRFDSEKFGGYHKAIAEELNGIQQVMMEAVSETMKSERMKTDLITNVSHDIKTPLTSIINYVDLLKRENIENERAKNYIDILEQKSYRLKHLTEDLVEASKISSGNIKLEYVTINLQEMLCQTNGEFIERFAQNNLHLVENMPQEPIYIRADGRRLWRVIENLYNNVSKYAMPNTRVYVDLIDLGTEARISIKNISEQSLNIEANELTERFIRGDVSRSTEGSGLGLSIARNLTELQGGRFDIYLDGDLFRVTISFPKVQIEEPAEETAEEEAEEDEITEDASTVIEENSVEKD
ncbi:MAG: histidine kinase dimerization/phospho-acceptor domain-containing protein [Lachnospiraceae bacterium]